MKKALLVLAGLLAGLAMSESAVRLFVSVRSVGPAFSRYDRLYGKVLKKSFEATRITPEFTMEFSTNSYGFRGPEPPSFPARPILFLGDSFTAGYGVSDGEEFPDLVRKATDERYGKFAVPVVNAGMGNSGTGRWIKFLEHEGGHYNPRLTVFQITGNDFRDNGRENFFRLEENGELVELSVPRMGFVRIVQNIVDKVPGLPYSHLVGLANQARWWYFEKNRVPPGEARDKSWAAGGEDDDLTYRLLERAVSICKKSRWPMLAISVGVDGNRLSTIKEIFLQAGVPMVQVPAREERPDLYYEIDGHWNARGHAHAAGLVMGRLEDFDLKM